MKSSIEEEYLPDPMSAPKTVLRSQDIRIEEIRIYGKVLKCFSDQFRFFLEFAEIDVGTAYDCQIMI